MIRLGITGGIGSGKSYVANLLLQRGIPLFDCDSNAKRLTLHDVQIRSGLIELLGPEVYTSKGINKRVLASYLFSSKENARRINKIIHPRVKECFREWTSEQYKQGKKVVAMESAILFESGFDSEVDLVIMVHAPLDVRYQRVIARDGLDLEEIKKRVASQMADEVKCNHSDFIIENDGIVSLKEQIDKLFSRLKGIKGEK